MKQLITTELRQKQTISAQQYHSLRILQMNRMELDEYMKDAALDNPMLELDESSRDTGMQSLDALREHVLWVQSQPVDYSGNTDHDEEDRHTQEWRPQNTGESLREHLESQFDYSITQEEYRLLSSIIHYLDPCGYLRADIPELSGVTGYSEEIVGYAVSYIQTMDPLGVGARNLSECLRIQLEMLGYRDKAIFQIVDHYLEDMAVGRYNKIAKGIGIAPQETRRLCGIIKQLNPKPAACFGDLEFAPVVPDATVVVEDGRPVAVMNGSDTPRLFISSYYSKLMKEDAKGEAGVYLEEKLNQARWMMEAVENRKKTLRQVTETIVEYQRAFFLKPFGELQPLTLRQVAQQLGIHESTVSRAINGKYLQCDRGAFPYKYFFAARGAGGEDASSRNAIQKRIAEMIRCEDSASPLSDSRIVELLAQDGIPLSRRAVAKYRQEMNISGTSVRRKT